MCPNAILTTLLNNEYGIWTIYIKRESNNYTPLYFYKLHIATVQFKSAYGIDFYN